MPRVCRAVNSSFFANSQKSLKSTVKTSNNCSLHRKLPQKHNRPPNRTKSSSTSQSIAVVFAISAFICRMCTCCAFVRTFRHFLIIFNRKLPRKHVNITKNWEHAVHDNAQLLTRPFSRLLLPTLNYSQLFHSLFVILLSYYLKQNGSDLISGNVKNQQCVIIASTAKRVIHHGILRIEPFHGQKG